MFQFLRLLFLTLVSIIRCQAQDYKVIWSPNEDRLVYLDGVDKNQEIYVANADGTDKRRLTNNSRVEKDPVFTPDGQNVVYISSTNNLSQIYSVGIDGSNEKNLTNSRANELFFSISPDGKKIAFISTRQVMAKLYMMNIDGSNQEYFYDSDVAVMYTSWVPNTNTLIFHELMYGTTSYTWGSVKDKIFKPMFPNAETITTVEAWIDNQRAIINNQSKDFTTGDIYSQLYEYDFETDQKKKLGKMIKNLNSVDIYSNEDSTILLINAGNSFREKSPVIFIHKLGEKKPEKLIKGYEKASFSPSGKYIAMIKEDQYYIMNLGNKSISKLN